MPANAVEVHKTPIGATETNDGAERVQPDGAERVQPDKHEEMYRADHWCKMFCLDWSTARRDTHYTQWTGTYEVPKRPCFEPWANVHVFQLWDKCRAVVLLTGFLGSIVRHWLDVAEGGEDEDEPLTPWLGWVFTFMQILPCATVFLQLLAVKNPEASLVYRVFEKLLYCMHSGKPPFAPTDMAGASLQFFFYGLRSAWGIVLLRTVFSLSGWIAQDPALAVLIDGAIALHDMAMVWSQYAQACIFRGFVTTWQFEGKFVKHLPPEWNGITVHRYSPSVSAPIFIKKDDSWVIEETLEEAMAWYEKKEVPTIGPLPFWLLVIWLSPGIMKLLLWHTPHTSFAVWGVYSVSLQIMTGVIFVNSMKFTRKTLTEAAITLPEEGEEKEAVL